MQLEQSYRHFCPMAQALERLGQRWGLLIVRDLLSGELRFTDLLGTCGGITPRQLSARLRQLEGAGIVKRDQAAGRREVRYGLTPAGAALRPAIEALLLWGAQHIERPPADDEPVRPSHLLNGTRLVIGSAIQQPPHPVRWVWRFPEEPYTLRFDGKAWQMTAGEEPDADVVVNTTPREWAEFVATRDATTKAFEGKAMPIRLLGGAAQLREFRAIFPRIA